MTIRAIHDQIRDRLQSAGIEAADYESRIMMEHYLNITREEYLLEPGKEIDRDKILPLFEAAAQRAERIPLAYLIGEAPFMGYSFQVNEHVLIPRMDTECLADRAVSMIRKKIEERNQPEQHGACAGGPPDKVTGTGTPAGQRRGEPVRVLDLCSGSGCIGISVKLLCPQVEVVLSDLSAEAVAIACRNAERLEASVRILQGDLFEPVDGDFDFILSNPPYIPSDDIRGLMPEVRDHEPRLALDGEEDGLAFYRRIIGEAGEYLRPGGNIMFEIGAWQGEAVRRFLEEKGFDSIRIDQDLAGFDRVVTAGLPEP